MRRTMQCALLWITAWGACGGTEDVGKGHLVLSVDTTSAAVNIHSVEVIVTNPEGLEKTIPLFKEGDIWQGTFYELPVGEVSLTAFAFSEHGRALFETPRAVSARVGPEGATAVLLLHEVDDVTGGFFNAVPVIDGVFASKPFAMPGETLDLSVFAHDNDHDDLSFQWEASAGEIGSPTTPETQWKAPEIDPGARAEISFTVTVQDESRRATIRITLPVGDRGDLTLAIAGFNAAPQIEDMLSSNPTPIDIGESTNLSIFAADESQESLTFSWFNNSDIVEINGLERRVCQGYFSHPTGSTTTFTVEDPGIPLAAAGPCVLSVIVTDEHGLDNIGTLVIESGADDNGMFPLLTNVERNAQFNSTGRGNGVETCGSRARLTHLRSGEENASRFIGFDYEVGSFPQGCVAFVQAVFRLGEQSAQVLPTYAGVRFRHKHISGEKRSFRVSLISREEEKCVGETFLLRAESELIAPGDGWTTTTVPFSTLTPARGCSFPVNETGRLVFQVLGTIASGTPDSAVLGIDDISFVTEAELIESPLPCQGDCAELKRVLKDLEAEERTIDGIPSFRGAFRAYPSGQLAIYYIGQGDFAAAKHVLGPAVDVALSQLGRVTRSYFDHGRVCLEEGCDPFSVDATNGDASVISIAFGLYLRAIQESGNKTLSEDPFILRVLDANILVQAWLNGRSKAVLFDGTEISLPITLQGPEGTEFRFLRDAPGTDGISAESEIRRSISLWYANEESKAVSLLEAIYLDIRETDHPNGQWNAAILNKGECTRDAFSVFVLAVHGFGPLDILSGELRAVAEKDPCYPSDVNPKWFGYFREQQTETSRWAAIPEFMHTDVQALRLLGLPELATQRNADAETLAEAIGFGYSEEFMGPPRSATTYILRAIANDAGVQNHYFPFAE